MIRQRCKEAMGVIAAAMTAIATAPAEGTDSFDVATPWTGHGNAPGANEGGLNTTPGPFQPGWRLPDPAGDWGGLVVIDLWSDHAPVPDDRVAPPIDDAATGRLDPPLGAGGAPPVPGPGALIMLAAAGFALGTRRRRPYDLP